MKEEKSDRWDGREGRKGREREGEKGRGKVRKGGREAIRESGQGGRNRFLIYSQFHHLYRGKDCNCNLISISIK